MYKKFFALFLFLLLINNNVFAQDKLVFIDVNYIFNNSVAGKKINEEITKLSKKIKSDLKNFQKKISSDKDSILKQKNVLSEEEFKKKITDLDNKVKNFNLKLNKENNQLIKLKKKARIKFSDQLREVLESFSKENSINMILTKENVLIGRTDLDVTSDILDLYNKNFKKITVK